MRVYFFLLSVSVSLSLCLSLLFRPPAAAVEKVPSVSSLFTSLFLFSLSLLPSLSLSLAPCGFFSSVLSVCLSLIALIYHFHRSTPSVATRRPVACAFCVNNSLSVCLSVSLSSLDRSSQKNSKFVIQTHSRTPKLARPACPDNSSALCRTDEL